MGLLPGVGPAMKQATKIVLREARTIPYETLKMV